VTKGVRLTSSVPLGFKPMKWNEEWGKYHIHYDRTKRVINLVDHELSDGAWLANYPIKYLDN
jgi:predicted acylesterase/phospholipase RssA